MDELPAGTTGKALTDFSDEGQTAPWAKEAMTLFVKTGTMGGSGDKLLLEELIISIPKEEISEKPHTEH